MTSCQKPLFCSRHWLTKTDPPKISSCQKRQNRSRRRHTDMTICQMTSHQKSKNRTRCRHKNGNLASGNFPNPSQSKNLDRAIQLWNFQKSNSPKSVTKTTPKHSRAPDTPPTQHALSAFFFEAKTGYGVITCVSLTTQKKTSRNEDHQKPQKREICRTQISYAEGHQLSPPRTQAHTQQYKHLTQTSNKDNNADIAEPITGTDIYTRNLAPDTYALSPAHARQSLRKEGGQGYDTR